MSIHYCVAATLAQGKIDEANYHLLADPEVMRLLDATTVEADADFTAGYPGAQGAEVAVTLRSGQTRRRRLRDLVPASASEIRARFRSASEKGSERRQRAQSRRRSTRSRNRKRGHAGRSVVAVLIGLYTQRKEDY